MREIVTVQLGEQANYVGTHFWNIQESYFTYSGDTESPVDHDVHFRPGIAVDGTDTYTPRAIVYDFKAKWGSLRRLNELYDVVADAEADRAMWEGSLATQKSPPVQPSEYQQALNAGVSPAPVTADQIPEAELNPGQTAFDDWQSGEDLFEALNREDDLFDRDVRPFIEECDQMQGLQLFTSADNAWSAFSSRYAYRLRDELGKMPIWVWSAEGRPASTVAQRARKLANESRGVYEMSQSASKFIPMVSMPSRRPSWVSSADWRLDSAWFRAALQTTALESSTLGWRLKRQASSSEDGAQRASMDQFTVEAAAHANQSIAQLEFEVKDASEERHMTNGMTNGQITETSERCELFPHTAATERQRFAEIMFTRGSDFDEQEDVRGQVGPKMHRYESGLMFPLLDSFPRFFGRRSTAAAVRTRLTSSDSIATWLRSVETTGRRHLPLEERESVGDGLRALADAYATGSVSDDDGGDDDEYN